VIRKIIQIYENKLKPRLKKILIGLIIFFVVFTLVGFFVLPPVLKSVLTKKLSENLHREVTITQIKVNPYTLSLTIRGFKVKDRKGSETFVSFDELFVNLQTLSVFKLALIFKEIRLTNPLVRISRHQDQFYNFSDLIKKEEPKPESKAEGKGKPLRFSFNNITIENGSIDFWDGPKQTKHTVRELNIGLPFLSNVPAQINVFVHPVFSAKVNETPYAIQGETKPFADSLETTFDINIKDFDIPYYFAYFPLKLNFKIVSAYLDMQTKVSFIQHKKDKEPSVTVSGSVSLKKVALDDVRNNPLFRLPLIEIGIAPTEPLKKIFHLSKVSIQSPELEVQRNSKGTLNIESLLLEKREAHPSPAPEKKEDQAILSIDVDEMQLTGGKISFSDLSRKKPFKTILAPIELRVAHFSNGKDKKTTCSLSIASEAKENIKLEGELSIEPLWAEGRLEIKSVPLMKYSPYYQDQILFNLEEGRLDFSTRYRYAKGEKEPEISLSGLSVILNSLRLKRQDEKEDFLKIPALSVKDTLVDVTQKKLTIGTFSTEKGMLTLNRFKNGEFDLQKLFPPSPTKEESPVKDKGKRDEKKWIVALNMISVDQYTIKMGDQSSSQPTTLTGEKITLRGENISTAKNALGKLSLSFLLDQTGTLSTKNTIGIDPLRIEGSLEVKHLVLNKYAPYYQDSILFNIEEGDLDLFTNYQYRKTDKDTVTKLSGLSMSLKTLRLKKRDEGENFVNLPNFSIKNTGLDLTNKELSIGDVSAQKGSVLVRRYSNGKLNLQTLFPESPKPQEKPSQGVEKPHGKPWLVKVGKVSLDQYTIKAEDRTTADPVTLVADEINLKAENLSTAKGQRSNASLALRLNQKGTVSANGPVGINPIFGNLKMGLKGIDIRSLQPYFSNRVKIIVEDGNFSTAGNLLFSEQEGKGVQLTYKGDCSLANFASIDMLNAEDLLKWESLALNDVDIGYNPLYIHINGIALTNFYARLILHPDGSLNLQEVFKKEGEKKEAPTAPQPQKKESPPTKNQEASTDIKIEKVTFQGGEIKFTDHYIKPNYSADIIELGGRISGLTSEETKVGEVELRGKLGGGAPVEITGKINPLKRDFFMDLDVKFKDIELSPLTPYSGRYVGYIIEKGKLTMELKYLLDHRKLDAKNKFFFDQLTLGDKVESPNATKLPVKLAIALLKDRKGEINLDIPVSGSLDDPKFSVWGIILKIIVNLLAKAATSPFALLGAVFGGGEELSYIEFDYGVATITEPNLKKIDTLIKTLSDRPALKLDIEGHVDLDRDREGLKQFLFQRKLKAQKLKEMLKKGEPAVPVDEVKIEKPEYDKYLKMAYKEEKFPKPKNVLGMTKDIPVPEMEKLIQTHLEVKDGDLRTLASQRALKVKEAIVKSGQVESERIFILEPKSLAPEKKEKLKESRVDFKLK